MAAILSMGRWFDYTIYHDITAHRSPSVHYTECIAQHYALLGTTSCDHPAISISHINHWFCLNIHCLKICQIEVKAVKFHYPLYNLTNGSRFITINSPLFSRWARDNKPFSDPLMPISCMVQIDFIVTSSNGNIFRVTGPLCGEFTGGFPWQRPLTWGFSLICAWRNGWVNSRYASDLRRHRAHYGITVMYRWGMPPPP